MFLDNQWIRTIFLDSYFQNRPLWFGRYYSWKPSWFSQKVILIVKTDAIGDYLLFRSLLEDISNEFRPKGYQVYLLGNALWKELAEELDGSFIDRFFWLKKGEFNQPLADQYRIGVVQQLNATVYDSILYPNLSREKLAGDWIVKNIPAKNKIGFKGDLQNQQKLTWEEGNKAYNLLIEPKTGTRFEFDRNREIVSVLLGKEPAIHKPKITHQTQNSPSGKYAVLFPGASTPLKQWPVEHFTDMAQWLHATFGFRIVVAGGPEDQSLGDRIFRAHSAFVENMAGKTTLLELINLIGRSALLVTNDTAAVHIGAHLGVPTTCIFKGNHYGRFLPYPEKDFPNVSVCTPHELNGLSFNELTKRYGETYGEDIEKVDPEVVKEMVSQQVNKEFSN